MSCRSRGRALAVVLVALLCLSGAGLAVAKTKKKHPPAPKPPSGPPAVYVFPIPGGHFASPATQLTFRGVSASQLGTITVTGSASGVHAGSVLADSDGDGGSFIPSTPFAAGETVTVSTSLNIEGSGNGSYQFQIATPAGTISPAERPAAPRVNGDVWYFRSRPDLTPAAVTITKRDPSATGDIFLAPQVGPLQQGPELIGPNGGLIWFDPVPQNEAATDFREQYYQGKPVLTWWQGNEAEGQLAAIGEQGEGVEGAVEGCAETLDFAGFGIDAVKTALDVAVLAFERAGGGLDGEVQPTAVGRPAKQGLDGFVVGELAGLAAAGGSEEDLVVGGVFDSLVDGAGFKRDRMAVGRGGDFGDGDRAFGDGLCAGRKGCCGFAVLFVCGFFVAVFRFIRGYFGWPVDFERVGKCRLNGLVEEHVAAVLFAPADHILPLGLLRLLLVVGERGGDGVVERGAVGRPGEGVDVELFAIKRQRLAAGDGDDPQAVGLVGFACGLAVVAGGFAAQGAVADESDPFAVGAPLRVFFAAGVGERTQARLRGPEPEVVAEIIRLPVGGLGGDDGGGAIGREAGVGDLGCREEFVESDGRLGGLRGDSGREGAQAGAEGKERKLQTHKRNYNRAGSG